MIAHLHVGLAVTGLVIGSAAAVLGGQQRRRPVVLPGAIALALAVWCATGAPPTWFWGFPALFATVVATAASDDGRPDDDRPLWWVPTLALPILGAVYLSVPDTEGPVILAATLAPLAVVCVARRWRGHPATVGWWFVPTSLAIIAVTGFSANGRFSLDGWWVAKLVLAAIELVLLVLAGASRAKVSPSARARPAR